MISSAIAQTADGAGQASSVLNNPSLWVAISFILFLALIAKPAWKFITSSLDKKIDEIRAKIEEATKLREEAQDILAAHKRKLSDAETEADDMSQFFGEVRVVSDPMSAQLLEGATLDFKDGLMGSGFAIDNPNAQRTCGCGSSFS